MRNTNSVMDALLPTLSPVQHTLSCKEDVQWFFIFVCLYQGEAHPIQGLSCIHVNEWICASKFADANWCPSHTAETMAGYKLWVCTLILVKRKSLSDFIAMIKN